MRKQRPAKPDEDPHPNPVCWPWPQTCRPSGPCRTSFKRPTLQHLAPAGGADGDACAGLCASGRLRAALGCLLRSVRSGPAEMARPELCLEGCSGLRGQAMLRESVSSGPGQRSGVPSLEAVGGTVRVLLTVHGALRKPPELFPKSSVQLFFSPSLELQKSGLRHRRLQLTTGRREHRLCFFPLCNVPKGGLLAGGRGGKAVSLSVQMYVLG